MNLIARLATCLVIVASTLVALPASASQPASQPATEDAPFTVVPLKLAATWVPEALAAAEVDVPDNVTFLYTNTNNCGAAISPVDLGGCTITLAGGKYLVLISPKLAYTAWGNHTLFHELAHTDGANECQAEAYAHQFEAVALWAYPECKVSE